MCLYLIRKGIYRWFIVRYIVAWAMLYCFLLFITLCCSNTPLVIIDLVIVWGNTLKFVRITSFLFYFDSCFLTYILSLVDINWYLSLCFTFYLCTLMLTHVLLVLTHVLLMFIRALHFFFLADLCSGSCVTLA